jgi:hypothetical protein
MLRIDVNQVRLVRDLEIDILEEAWEEKKQ